MFYWALVLLAIGLIAGAFGFGGVASTALSIAKFLVIMKIVGVILVLGAVGLLAHHFTHNRQLPPSRT